MNHRSLTAAAGGVVGNVSTGALTDGGRPPQREVEDISVSLPESSPISITATVTQASITPEQTAEFDLSVTWNGDENKLIIFENQIPFNEPNYSTSPSGLLLLTTDSDIERRNPEVWLPNTGDKGELLTNLNLVVAELDPGETVAETWAVWGDPRHVSHIEPGTYRFENEIGLASSLESETDHRISWALTIAVNTPE